MVILKSTVKRILFTLTRYGGGGTEPRTFNNVTVDKYGHVVDGKNNTDISGMSVNFNESETRLNISKTDNIATLFSKISKWFSDMKALAFMDKIGVSQLDTTLTTEYNKRLTKDNVTQSLVITEPGWVADARVLPNIISDISRLDSLTLKGNFDIYINPNGNDSIGTGTLENPYKTIRNALKHVPLQLNQCACTIRLANGVYNENMNVSGYTSGTLSFQGESTDTIINNTAPTAHMLQSNTARIIFDKVTFTATNTTGDQPTLYVVNTTFLYISNSVIDGTNGSSVRNAVMFKGSNARFNTVTFNNSNACIILFTAVSENTAPSNVSVYKCNGINNNYFILSRKGIVYLEDDSRPNTKYTDATKEGGLIIRSTGGTVGSLSSDLLVYVATTGNDSTGDGSSTKPFKTIQRAIDTIPKDLSGLSVTIQLTQGVYTDNIIIKGFYNGMIKIIGAVENSDASEISLYKINSVSIQRCFCHVALVGFEILDTVRDYALHSYNCAHLYIGFIQITTSSSKVGIGLFETLLYRISNCTITNKNIGVYTSNSHGTLLKTTVSATTVAVSSIGVSCVHYDVETKLTAPTQTVQSQGGTFVYASGTQISNLITSGLSCTWGTLSGGYIRHGNTNGTALITIQISVNGTIPLTAGTEYIITGFPRSTIGRTTVNYAPQFIIENCFIDEDGQIHVILKSGVNNAYGFLFNCTYLTT